MSGKVGSKGKFILERYNFSRRMVDHRVAKDFGSGQDQPFFTPSFFHAKKSWAIKIMFNYFGYTLSIVGLGIVTISTFTAHRRDKDPLERRRSLMSNNDRLPPAIQFLERMGDPEKFGKWNYVFGCYENTTGCGRDFDLYEKENK